MNNKQNKKQSVATIERATEIQWNVFNVGVNRTSVCLSRLPLRPPVKCLTLANTGLKKYTIKQTHDSSNALLTFMALSDCVSMHFMRLWLWAAETKALCCLCHYCRQQRFNKNERRRNNIDKIQDLRPLIRIHERTRSDQNWVEVLHFCGNMLCLEALQLYIDTRLWWR